MQRRILYTGPPLAGVGTSILYLAHVKGTESKPYPRLGLDTTTRDGIALSVQSDIRSSLYFESSAVALARCESAPAVRQCSRR